PARADYDLSSLRYAFTGAAAIPETLIGPRLRDFGGTGGTGYGLTESTGIVSVTRPGDDAHLIATTVGRAVEGVDVMISDDLGGEAAAGQAGGIFVHRFKLNK